MEKDVRAKEKASKTLQESSNLKKSEGQGKSGKFSPGLSIIIRIAVLVAFIIIMVFCCKKAYELGYGLFQNDAVEEGVGTVVFVNIPEKATEDDVAEILEYNGLISDKEMFSLRCMLYDAEFHPGTYTLNTNMTTEEILDVLRYPLEEEEEETTTQAQTKEAESETKAEDSGEAN